MTDVLVKDRDWSVISDRICLVEQFIPFALIDGNGLVQREPHQPYALVEIRCCDNRPPTPSGKFVGAVTHKLDFEALHWAYSIRGIGEDETLSVYWSKRELRTSAKLLSALMPRLAFTIWKTDSFRLLTERDYRPDLQGEARALACFPLLHFQPERWKWRLVSTELDRCFEKALSEGADARYSSEAFAIVSGPNKGAQSQDEIWDQMSSYLERWAEAELRDS